jgi:hypothetical protein
MQPKDIAKLRALTDFPALVAYLRDELDWPIEVEDAHEITFEYEAVELGIDPKHAVKIEAIKQVRPLVDNQPWGIFYIEFETKRLPVVVLRRILRTLVPRSRRRDPDRPVWRMDDLLFISAQGEVGYRSISFAHFRQREGRVAELRTFSWDSRETHFYYIKNLNLEALRWPEDETDINTWREQWGQAFAVEHRYVITTSQTLAREMARHAATMRELVNDVYGLETDDGPLHQLYASFKETLLHDLTSDAFADMVAQTVAYGLFSAATQSGDLTYDRMVELIPSTNPFLKDLLAELTTQGVVDLEELGVGQLVALLRQTDIEAILQDFGRQTGGGREDPVVHFYELFLSEYDKEQKVKRGVFYTPDPVVSYIVRSVNYLLKTEFGLEDGLADISVDPETGEPLVQILDPAAGTGTFLAHAIDQIERTVKAKPGVDWSAYVAEHLLPRLNGFELMMAPYAVAHMKLGLKLRQTGYDFASGERLRVYLTNTVEEPVEAHETLALAGFLSKEASAAARVKRQTPVTVILGNPPYSYSSRNTGEWINSLVRDYYQVNGHSLDERNPKGLQDDYVKFLRFGQWRIDETGGGILAMITNHGYLDNPTFNGMRQQMMQAFSEIYVLDLHGNLNKKETAPDGSKDENVFDIQQGVAICLMVRRCGTTGSARVRHADLFGLRERKYEELAYSDVQHIDWSDLEPKSPSYLFVPLNAELESEYGVGRRVTDIMPMYSSCMNTARDSLVVDVNREELLSRIQMMADLSKSTKQIAGALGIKDTGWWSFEDARKELLRTPFLENQIIKCLYRPFDRRWLFHNPDFIDRPRTEVNSHMLEENLSLVTTRQTKEPFAAVATNLVCGQHKIAAVYDRSYFFPLYRYTIPESTQNTLFASERTVREPNLSSRFIADVKRHLGLAWVPRGCGNLATTVGPEDVFHYGYAVFYSPTYRIRYESFLKRDFPRLPLTSNLELFHWLCTLGADLVALHLLEDGYPAASWNQTGGAPPLQHPITTFVEGVNGTTMGAFSKSTCYQDGDAPHGGRVYLDTSQRKRSSYFDGVPEDVWNFHIGGYQVCYKWLYDRRGKRGEPGRTLTAEDIAHYKRIVVALKETIQLMGEVDEVIEAYGGWPIE